MRSKGTCWKKGTLLVLAIIVLIRILYIFIGLKVERTYSCSTGEAIPDSLSVACTQISQDFKSTYKRLNSLEFIFSELPQDATGKITIKILSNDELLYQSDVSVNNIKKDVWHKIYVNIPIESNVEYQLQMSSAEGENAPKVYITKTSDVAPSESIRCKVGEQYQSGQLLMRYGYLKEPTLVDKVMNSLVWIIVYVFCFMCLQNYEKIMAFLKKVEVEIFNPLWKVEWYIVEFILCFILIENSGIEFQIHTKILFLLISFISMVSFQDKVVYIKKSITKLRDKIGFVFLLCYSAFALVGNRTFIYPLDLTVTFAHVITYLIAILWFFPVILSFLFFYDRLTISYIGDKLKLPNILVVSGLLLIIPAIFALYAFNPGISSSDTYRCLYEYAHSIEGMPNWHPPFYILLLKAIISVWDSTYAVVFVQWLFWIFVMLEMITFLLKRGISKKIIIVVAFILGSSTSNYLHICTIWKDIPYALSTIWLTIIIAKLALDFEYYKKRILIFLELAIALILVCLLRQNGIVVYLLVALSLLVVMRKKYKVIMSVVLSMAVVLIIQFPVYSHLKVQEAYKGGEYMGLSQDILGVYYYGGDLSKETIQMINVLTDYNNAKFKYNPYYIKHTYNLDVSKGEFILNYLDTFFRNPILMLREVVCRQDCMWDLFLGEKGIVSCVDYHQTVEDTKPDWTDYYQKHYDNSFSIRMKEITGYSVSNQILNMTQWRTGLYFLLVILASYVLLRKNRNILFIIFIPFVGQVLSLLLSTGWPDFRYYWPLNLMSVFIILLIPTIPNKQE